jgi:HSP20 family protein
MIAIDEAIDNVERLYRNLTGKEASTREGSFSPIPAEKDPGEHVEEQLDRLLEVLEGRAAPGVSPSPELMPPRAPAVALWESETEYLLRAELPGVPRDRVEVSVGKDALTISAPAPPEVPEMRLRASEILLSPFRRTFPLPPGLRVSETTACLRDGLLEIRIAREEKAPPESVAVTVS